MIIVLFSSFLYCKSITIQLVTGGHVLEKGLLSRVNPRLSLVNEVEMTLADKLHVLELVNSSLRVS